MLLLRKSGRGAWSGSDRGISGSLGGFESLDQQDARVSMLTHLTAVAVGCSTLPSWTMRPAQSVARPIR
jgi:hypothetical protein